MEITGISWESFQGMGENIQIDLPDISRQRNYLSGNYVLLSNNNYMDINLGKIITTRIYVQDLVCLENLSRHPDAS